MDPNAAKTGPQSDTNFDSEPRSNSYAATEKGRWERLWPVIACGAGARAQPTSLIALVLM